MNAVHRPPSPVDRVFNNDYNDDYNYDQDRRSVYSGRSAGGRDHSPERERYTDSGYQTRDYDRDYDRRDHGRSAERDPSPDRQYRRDGSRGRALERERSPERPYHGADRSPDRRFRSERALDRPASPDRRYRSERTLDRADSPDLRRGGRGRSFERGDQRKFEEPPMKRSGSRDRLARSPSPAAMPIPLARAAARDMEPLEKPMSIMLLKNRPHEGEEPSPCFSFTCRLCVFTQRLYVCLNYSLPHRVRPSSRQPALHQRDDEHRTGQQRREPAGRRHHPKGRVTIELGLNLLCI